MKMLRYSYYILFWSLCIVNVIASLSEKNQGCTDVARDEESLLLLSTLSGNLVALEPLTGTQRWAIEDEPALKVPQPKSGQFIVSQFLPDPRDGSLYTWHNAPKEKTNLNDDGLLHKMPLTIPQLVANAPCRSSDGILYSGRKSDAWSLVDIKTGARQKVLGFDDFSMPTAESSRSHVLLGRSYYTILMYNAATKNAWNVTYVDYSAHTMTTDLLNDYDFVHLSGSASGRTATFDQVTGSLLWDFVAGSPVVAMYILNKNGLLAVPFTTVSDDTLNNIISNTKSGNGKDIKLFPTLYVGEHLHGIYALPSLIDGGTAMIKEYPNTFLIAGPENAFPNKNNLFYNNKLGTKHSTHTASTYLKDYRNFILLGHYQIPMSHDMKLQIGPNRNLVPFNQRNYPGLIEAERKLHTDNNKTVTFLKVVNGSDKRQNVKRTVGVQTSEIYENDKIDSENFEVVTYLGNILDAFSFQENGSLKFTLVILLVLLITLLFSRYYKEKEFKRWSAIKFSNMDNPNDGSEKPNNDLVKVGKITFDMTDLLGKGCDGTFVYKGVFESRAVAVKRLLPECFSLAEREVDLLRESDTHPNVVRYYCTEQDRQFKYIALELCGATLQDYVDKSLNFKCNTSETDLLCQATDGLSHLHSLNIVHRDIKPHNVLLSLPDTHGYIRAMISDFGLCKKLLVGKQSFSKTSGIAGTEGWIAPEMLKGERTTTAVDIFSLGCVFYYVLSHGSHPFGGPLHRQANILSGHSSLATLHDKPLAQNLLSSMIAVQCEKRPPISAVRLHPVFWNESRALAFLQDISDRIEKDAETSMHMIELEKEAHQVVKNDWRRYLDPSISEDLRKYRTYLGNSVRDLLRAIRNKKHHYHQLSPEAVLSLGPLPVSFTRYWLERFPLLLVHVWGCTQSLRHEPALLGYYDSHYIFPLWYTGKPCDICIEQAKLKEKQSEEFQRSPLKIVFLTKPDRKVQEGGRENVHDSQEEKMANGYVKQNGYVNRNSYSPLVNGIRNKIKKVNKEKQAVYSPMVWAVPSETNK